MKLSDGEKLIIAMLCDLHEAAKIKHSVDPKFIREAISGGHPWAIKQRYVGIFVNEDDTDELRHEVYDILNMWSLIEHSYKMCDDDEITRIRQELGRDEPYFQGFDGNNEVEHLSAAQFIVDYMDAFASLKKKVVNSHFPVLSTYRRMLSKFDISKYDDVKRALPVDDLIRILDPRVIRN